MGLPMWRDPDEKKSTTSSAKSEDPTACARSSIRRRPAYAGRSTRPRLPRDLSARLDRSSSLLSGSVDILNSRIRALGRLESAEEPSPQPSTFSSENTLVELLWDANQGMTLQDWDTVRLGDNDGDTNHSNQTSDATEGQAMPPMGGITPPWENSASTAAPMSRSRSQRPRSRHDPGSLNTATARRTSRPGSASDALHDREVYLLGTSISQPATRRSHPLSHSWRPGSPIDGLGDRDRSPQTDAWEVIRTTITPDETLPSADSSFTSAAASQSFNASNGSGISTSSSSNESRNTSANESRSTSFSSVEPDDLICVEDEALRASSAFARAMFRLESNTIEGLQRIDEHQANHVREGNQFAFANESMIVDIGFRLIEEALGSPAGHIRLDQVRRAVPASNVSLDQVIRSMETLHRNRTSSENRTNNELSQSSATSERENTDAYVHNDLRHHARSERQGRRAQNYTTIPVIEINSDSDDDTPYSRTREREASESLLTGDIQDLESMRRVIERFAARDDVPDEWWMSMGLNPVGLNISSTQSRQRRSRVPEGPAAGPRTRTRTSERGP